MRKLSCSPNAEVIGITLHSYLDNLTGDVTAPIFKRHGLINLEPTKWYPLHPFLEALNELAALPGMSLNMTAIGMKIGEDVPTPPEIGPEPTLEQVLIVWDAMYQMLHRGADVGRIWVEKIGEKHFKTFHTNPYPDDMTFGVLYGYGRRFLHRRNGFNVYFDKLVPARDYGGRGDHTIVHIEWV